jgi:pimeloyl-ACP methyl ester carboxylesterase
VSDEDGLPPISRLAGEGLAIPALFRRAPACRVACRHANGRGRPVLVIPGLLAGDLMTERLRRTLQAAGYKPYGWKLGLNRGIARGLLDRIAARLEAIVRTRGRPAAVVGWSLGGLYARELAKCRPALVERVITLGTPFSADRHANRAWRLYELAAGHDVYHPPVDFDLHAKPPVPTVAVWSPEDGIVAERSARGLAVEADARLCVRSSHLGFVSDERALDTVLTALERPI